MRLFYSTIQKLVEYRYRNKDNLGKVFMFHQIVNNSLKDTFQSNMCLDKNEFYKFINLLLNIGTIKKIEDLTDLGKQNDFYITFDDIYYNAYENAIDWLTDIGIPFTVFITLNFLDHDNYITTDQLKALTRNKYCTIGSHTLNHPILRFMDYDDVLYEMITSKAKLEVLTGRDINYFAYPYGSKYACSKKVVRAAKEAGYKYAFSTFSMGIDRKYFLNNPYFVPRINVDKHLVEKMEEYNESNC